MAKTMSIFLQGFAVGYNGNDLVNPFDLESNKEEYIEFEAGYNMGVNWNV